MTPRRAGLSVAVLAALSDFALAAGAEHGGEHPAPGVGTLLFPVINFVLFLGLLWRFAWPAIQGALAERKRLIEKELGEGAAAKREAEERLAAVRARRAGLDEEGGRMIETLRAEAERDRRAVIEAARETAERIRRDARLLGEQEGARAAMEIRREVAGRVVADVAARLRTDVSGADEERLVREFLGAVDSEAAR